MDSEFDELISFIREIYHKPEGNIPLHEPVFKGNEIKYVNNCISSTFVSSIGKYVDLFEAKIAEYTSSKYAVATVNGTSALHLALKLAGVKDGDEVITQPLTFIATANAITYCNAVPVFTDVDKDTMGLSPEKLENFIKRSTKYDNKSRKLINKQSLKPITAVVPMHTFGNPCRIEAIVETGIKYGLPVIEDAAESLGSRCNQRHTGTFGKIGILSFNGNKIITTGGGGMILTDDERIAKLAKHLTTQAKVPHPWEFFHDQTGFNYRMPNINAALGVAQMELLDEFVENKRNTSSLYQSFCQKHDIHFFTEAKNCVSNYWLNTIALASKTERDRFLSISNSKGVMIRPAWTLMCNLPMFSGCQKGDLSNAVELSDTMVNLPSGYRSEGQTKLSVQ